MEFEDAPAHVCFAVAALGCVYLLALTAVVLRLRRETPALPDAWPAVTIVKPLHGLEPHLFERLSAFCRQDYPAPVQLIFGTHDRSDPALAVVERLKQAYPNKDIVALADPHEHGSNRKVSNLINMIPAARHDVLLMADSDIEIGPDCLKDMVARLSPPDVGAVSCLYHGIAGTGAWAKLSALAINTHFLPQAVFALTFGLAQPCFGAAIAIRREVLERIGGLTPFADVLAEDYALGNAVRALGYRVVIPSFSVGHASFDSSAGQFLRQQLRAARTIKSIDPVGYTGSLIVHPLPLALMAAVLDAPKAMLLTALALACRFVLCMAVEHRFAVPRQSRWLLPLQDVMAFGVYLASFFGKAVSWRGQRYRLGADGVLIKHENRR